MGRVYRLPGDQMTDNLVARLRNQVPGWNDEAAVGALLLEAAERIEELEAALKPFATIKPSSLFAADGSENEEYVTSLYNGKRMLGDPEFTGKDLARARAALGS
jgi:hypothetical protein